MKNDQHAIEPAFLDDEGPSEPPAHVCTGRLADVLAGMTNDELASYPGEIADQERNRRDGPNPV